MTPRLVSLLAFPALLLLSACDLFEPSHGPPAALDPTRLPPGLIAGETVALGVTITDSEDRPVPGEPVLWTASPGTGIVEASEKTDEQGLATATWDLGTETGDATLTVEAGGLRHTFSATIDPGPLDTIVVEPAPLEFQAIGDTVTLTARAQDAFGNPISVPSFGWSSENPTIASVEDGVVVSHANGVVAISAATGTMTGRVAVTVRQVVAALAVDPPQPVMAIGESLALEAFPVDARGVRVDTAVDLVWSSASPTIASVDADGNVQALGEGTAEISVTAAGQAGRVGVDVIDGVRPTITDIQPALLLAGDTAVITGTDFSAAAGVEIGGQPAEVFGATATELRVRLPGVGAFPCLPTGDMDVVVDVDRLTAVRAHPVAGAPRHSLAVGESTALLGSEVACGELTEPGSYMISVFSAAPSHGTRTAFTLRGTAPQTAALLADGLGTVRPRMRIDPAMPSLEPDPATVAHMRVMEMNERLVERLGPPSLRTVDPQAPAILADVVVGETRRFRIPDLDQGNICASYISVTARAAYVGEYGVIWEDVAAPLAGDMNDRWAAVGAEYDEVMHPLLLANFGDPLVVDDRLDANGKFFMLFSKQVNDFQQGVAGFVFAGDFYDRTDCPSSDGAEIFYGRVPTSGEPGYGDGTVDSWAWSMRSTVIHETKHITSYANKLDVDPSSPNFEQRGLEEATARLSEEFYGRALQGYGQGDNVDYDSSVGCEVRVGENYPECDPIPYNMGKHFAGLYSYLRSPASLSPFGPASSQDYTYYGSGWQLVRWAIDQSGVPEDQFIKALVREPVLTGAANLAARAGRPLPDLLADYTLAFATDDMAGFTPVDSRLTVPGWNTRDILAGLNADFPTTYSSAWPLDTFNLPGGDFEAGVTNIRGGGAMIFELTGSPGAQLLELLSESGGEAPSILGLSVVRIQ